MKFTSGILVTLAALTPAVIAAGKIKVEVRYTKDMVDVGNLDIFRYTWQKIYGEPGNQRSVLTEDKYDASSGQCMSWADGPDRNVRVKINGQWGRVPGLGPHDSREALVQALYKVLTLNSDPTGYNVFTNCYGKTWQEGSPIWGDRPHACGTPKASVRPHCMCLFGGASCEFHSWGHKVPSSIKANLYRDGVLLADSLIIDFSSNKVVQDNGCGTIGKIASTVAGFLPGPGSLFAAGIDVFCG
ncbi:hypothetical protein DL766_000050 [Monosporascus sp. MC13-8B]|uniref:Ecp2 effector protein domain-containing protein n=1 Tax=Monosporascus cannonballus TaxID=155416 RepID=A0ABY0HMG6_9PEZI|nr:hypothetical protein DL762_000419 [Monosporascus cannonballus]RYP01179.1 hypothetical protein DL763_000304 [Monosporascus cannonballus]RYP40249.1 hypothetical protein DL766_000050 [Monosporascus sp. MC13-8B]